MLPEAVRNCPCRVEIGELASAEVDETIAKTIPPARREQPAVPIERRGSPWSRRGRRNVLRSRGAASPDRGRGWTNLAHLANIACVDGLRKHGPSGERAVEREHNAATRRSTSFAGCERFSRSRIDGLFAKTALPFAKDC